MGVNTRREGVLDFLLAGFAGGATGVSRGLQTRQARKEREAAAKAQADFRRLTLSLQKQGIDIQRLSQEGLAEHRQSIIEQSALDREQRVLDREQRLKIEQERRKPIPPIPLTDAEERLQELDIRTKEAEAETAEQKIRIDSEGAKLREAKFEFEKAKETAAGNVADRNYQLEIVKLIEARESEFAEQSTRIFIKRLGLVHDTLEKSELNFIEKGIIGEAYRAIELATESGKESDAAVANLRIKDLNTVVKKHAPDLQIQGKVDFRKQGFLGKLDVFNVFFDPTQNVILPPEEDAPQSAPQIGPPEPPVQRFTDPLDSILGPIGDRPVRDTSRVDALLQQLVPGQQQTPVPVTLDPVEQILGGTGGVAGQEPSAADLSQDVVVVIAGLNASNKTLSKEFEKALVAKGFSEQEITTIKTGTKQKEKPAKRPVVQPAARQVVPQGLRQGLTGSVPKNLNKLLKQAQIFQPVINALPVDDSVKGIIANNLFAKLLPANTGTDISPGISAAFAKLDSAIEANFGNQSIISDADIRKIEQILVQLDVPQNVRNIVSKNLFSALKESR